MGGLSMSKWEIIEYKLDESGKEVVSCSYEVNSNELGRTLEYLETALHNGSISSFAYTPL